MLKSIVYIQQSLSKMNEREIKNYQITTLNNRKCYLFKGNSEKIILIVHGMSIQGIDDIRILKQARILNKLGYTVYLPLYPEVKDLKIDYKTVEDIKNDINSIFSLTNAKLKVFSVSFSGGLSLLSIFQNQIHSKIDSIYLVGSFFEIDSTLKFFFTHPNIDPYGLLIILKNFIEFLPEYNDIDLKKAIEIAIHRNALNQDNEELENFLKDKPAVQQILQQLLYDSSFKKTILSRLLKSEIIHNHFIEKFNIKNAISKSSIKIILLHGKNDNVIPSQQSFLLFQTLQQNHIRSRMLITSLLDHGNVKFDFNLIWEFFQLVRAISLFLN